MYYAKWNPSDIKGGSSKSYSEQEVISILNGVLSKINALPEMSESNFKLDFVVPEKVNGYRLTFKGPNAQYIFPIEMEKLI